MNNKENYILIELIIGIILFGMIEQIICLWIAGDYLYNAIGLWCGVAIACFMAVHMKRSIEDALELGEEGAVKHVQRSYGTRMAVVAAAVIMVLIFKIGNPIALVLGILPLKFSAYTQPIIHKVFLWLKKDHEDKEQK